jgi:beta-carotene ketolase (CrtW type)
LIITNTTASSKTIKGLGLAFFVLLLWIISLIYCIQIDCNKISILETIILILVRTQFQTGLFIIGHDAMHGNILPNRLKLNNAIGASALSIYAALPYEKCLINHNYHHANPASNMDPDFPKNGSTNLINWYLGFMSGYLSINQMLILISTWIFAYWIIGCANIANIILFLPMPLLLSSVQLFLFGTYLPHRHQHSSNIYGEPESLKLPSWLSLLACYHFGYHAEHHQNPTLAWFELPAAHQNSHEQQVGPLELSD